jgi:hypothetical protein
MVRGAGSASAATAQPMRPRSVGQQDHRRVTVTVAVGLASLDQALDLGSGEILTGAQFGIGPAQRRDCPIFWWLAIRLRVMVSP